MQMQEWHEQFRQAEAARTLIFEVDQRWYGLAQVLERTGMDHNDELVRRLADRARQERYRAEAMASWRCDS
jgi:hypothetical protein